jgi:hypothetical protein
VENLKTERNIIGKIQKITNGRIMIAEDVSPDFAEGRELGIRDACNGLPNRFFENRIGEAKEFCRGYNQGWNRWRKDNPELVKVRESEFKKRCKK